MQSTVTFDSDGLKLTGTLHVPEAMAAGERRPALLVLHGFGVNRASGTSVAAARLFEQWGYVALRFDFRGCGDSEGTPGHLLCLDQVADTRNALAWLATRAEVDPARIGVFGHSFGAAVAVYAGGEDPRFAAVISSCGWGDGERMFRGQHAGAAAWARFTAMLEEGRAHRARTGASLMVPRWDIVPIPEHLRANLPAGSINEFPVETAQSMFDFRPDERVGRIAPRPLLLFHAANDSVTPSEQTLGLYARAGHPTDLVLLDDIDHFPFADTNPRAKGVLRGWLDRYFPALPAGA